MYIQQYCTSGEFDAAGNLGGTPRPRAARAGSLVNRRHAARPSIDAVAQPAPDHVAGEMRTVVPRPNADHAIPLSLQLHAAARAHRSAQSGRVARAMLRAACDLARRSAAAWRSRRLAKRAYVELQLLDIRTLRDTGLDRSEITSIAAEILGQAERTRLRVTQMHGGLYF
jgi:uncharacterized protein YjiS (DUF1127 family)